MCDLFRWVSKVDVFCATALHCWTDGIERTLTTEVLGGDTWLYVNKDFITLGSWLAHGYQSYFSQPTWAP